MATAGAPWNGMRVRLPPCPVPAEADPETGQQTQRPKVVKMEVQLYRNREGEYMIDFQGLKARGLASAFAWRRASRGAACAHATSAALLQCESFLFLDISGQLLHELRFG